METGPAPQITDVFPMSSCGGCSRSPNQCFTPPSAFSSILLPGITQLGSTSLAGHCSSETVVTQACPDAWLWVEAWKVI